MAPTMQKSMKGSVSLPDLIKRGREPTVQEIVQLPEIKKSYVGGVLHAQAGKRNKLRQMKQAKEKGDMQLLRQSLGSCKMDPEICHSGVVVQMSEDLAHAKHWMTLCETAIEKMEPASIGKLLKAVKELEKSGFGSQLWQDPMYRKLKYVQEWAPCLPVLRDLSLEYKSGARQYSIAWLEAIEGLELPPDLRQATAKWFQTLTDAGNVLKGVLEQEDIRLMYPHCPWTERHDLVQHLRDELETFQIDLTGVDTWAACWPTALADDEQEISGLDGVVVVVSGTPATLGRIKRLNLVEEGRQVEIETAEQKSQRVEQLRLMAGLSEPVVVAVQSLALWSLAAPKVKASPARVAAQASVEKSQALKERIAAREAQQKQEAVKHVAKFRRFLVERFGSVKAAWTNALDTDANNRLSYVEFCTAVRNIGFKGSTRAMWKELDKDGGGHITFDELDPNEHEHLSKFEKLVKDRYGSFKNAWPAFDTDKNGFLDQSEFTMRCKDLEYSGSPKKLFTSLLEKPGARHLRLVDFDPRSFQESISQPDLQAGLTRKELVEQSMQEAKALHHLPTDLASMKKMLVQKYGSLAAAWKHGLDADGNGMIHLHEFTKVVREMGFRGSIRDMWDQLDTSKNGTITLDELDLKSHEALDHFNELVIEKHGSYLDCWAAFKLDKMVKVDEAKFLWICEQLGYTGNGKRLFKNLLCGPGARSITLAELDHRVLEESYLNPEKDNPLSAKAKLEQRKQQEREQDMSISDYKGMYHTLVTRFGTIPAAMKHLLDRDRNGKVSFVEFCNGMREIGYKGGARKLWKELAEIRGQGDGVLTLKDFDKEAQEVMNEFQGLVIEKYGGFLEFWAFLDKERKAKVDEPTFVARCGELGFTGDAHKLFTYYLDHPSKNFIVLEDLDIDAAHESGLDPTRHDKTLKKKLYEQQTKERLTREQAPNDVQSLMNVLIKRYGTITSAWKHALDLHDNGKVSFMVFCRAMQQLGFRGDLKKVWLAIDANENGMITLDELDPDAHDAITQFQDLVRQKYGELDEKTNALVLTSKGWQSAWNAFDANKNLQLDPQEFHEQCQQIGFTGNSRLLFQYLLNKPGAKTLTFDDLDPQAAYESRLEEGRHDASQMRERKAEMDKRRVSQDMGASDFKSLKTLLLRRFGTIPGAWKNLLDVGGNGKIGFVDFCKAMRRVSFIGSLKDLWKEIDVEEKGVLTLENFDAEAYRSMEQFRRLVAEKFANWNDAWKEFDQDGNKFLSESEFDVVCESLGYQGNSAQLFSYLLDEPCCDFLTLEDLDIEAANESYLDPERHNTKAKFDALQIEKAKEQGLNVGHKLCDLPSVKASYLNQYGSITAAWRHALDLDANGRISFQEFCEALRGIGFKGDIRKLWGEIDDDKNGTISLCELDAEAYEHLVAFRNAALEVFGTMDAAWEVFDVNGSGRIDESEFGFGCGELSKLDDKDPAAIYRYLLDHPNSQHHWLHKEDFDCHITRRRGHHGFHDP